MKTFCSNPSLLHPKRCTFVWKNLFSSLRCCPQLRKATMGLDFPSLTPFSCRQFSSTATFHSSSTSLSISQLQSKVVEAISMVGNAKEAKAIADVEAQLSDGVQNGVRFLMRGTGAEGGSELASFIYKYLKNEVQFLSEDNIQHSRIVLRSKAPSSSQVHRSRENSGAPAASTFSRPPLPPCPSFGTSAQAGAVDSNVESRRPRTMIETLDRMVDYLPTSFVQSTEIASKIPKCVQELYADSNFIFFMKRFKHYVDIRTQHGYSELRLKPDFSHPRRGKGDHLYNVGFRDSTTRVDSSIRRPPRNSEAHLISFIVPRIPAEYTPLATVLSDVSDIVSRHPAFDPRLGVTGLLDKYPSYFQQKDGLVRARPYRSAPFSLEDFDLETSPEKSIFSKLFEAVEAAAEGKNFAEDKASAAISTGKLYALLTSAEKVLIKEKFRSFPRFLRLHGKCIVVSPDSMKVHLFKPEYEPCAESLLDLRLRENQLSPDDPVLKIPATVADNVSMDWAVKELYDALPLTQCAELDDILTLISPSVRSGLPVDVQQLEELLSAYPEYFSVWAYPDDASIRMVQRAKVETPDYSTNELISLILPIIPDGGIPCNAFIRRLPLSLQRFFYWNGLRKTLEKLTAYVQITKDDRIIRIS